MPNRTLVQILGRLIELRDMPDGSDLECGHIEADELIIEVIRMTATDDIDAEYPNLIDLIIRAYDAIPKYYH